MNKEKGETNMPKTKMSLEHQWEGLYSMPLPSTRTGMFYNLFSYPTKISPDAIAVYIAMHTKPGDTVLDVFGGSGSTGVAALMCEHPTDTMIALAQKLNLEPVWGARNAIVYEIGKYGAFASSVLANPPERKEFSLAVKRLLSDAENEMPCIYDTFDAYGKAGTVRHIVYSDIVLCPKCSNEFTYYEGMVRHDPLKIDGDGKCIYCGYKDKSSSFSFATQTIYDSLLGIAVTRRKRVPVRIYGQSGSNKWVREANESDVQTFESSETIGFPSGRQANKIEWGELYRSGYHTGITHLHHFYTKRNYTVMSLLWEKADEYPLKVRNALRLLLLSYNASHSTLMTRVVVKKNSKDFVLTSAQSGVLYISSLPVEKNIVTGVKRKLRFFEQAFDYLNKCSGQIEVFNSSSQQLCQHDKSIDYIFTDPPFGDFIPYAEVNQINELWLGETTNRSGEIIISQSQKKAIPQYQEMMSGVFNEMTRVLKDNANATVVFHSPKAAVWNALRSAYSEAGLTVEASTSLDKKQASFKQVVSDGSVQGDPLILLSKGDGYKTSSDSQVVLDDVIESEVLSVNWNERKIYSRYIGKCLENGVMVEYDARTVYSHIAQRVGAAI
jgi:16S rRNA G966 N2-methylase RsmD